MIVGHIKRMKGWRIEDAGVSAAHTLRCHAPTYYRMVHTEMTMKVKAKDLIDFARAEGYSDDAYDRLGRLVDAAVTLIEETQILMDELDRALEDS